MIRFVALASLLLLAACGFEPMYGERSSDDAVRAGVILSGVDVEVQAPEMIHRELAQQLRMALEDGMNPSGDERGAHPYRLVSRLTIQEVPIAVAPDGTFSRYNTVMHSDFTLSRMSDGKPVFQGTARRIGSYNNLSNEFYSTYVAEQDTLKRTTQALAKDIQLRLAAFFAQNPSPEPLDMKTLEKKQKQAESPPARPLNDISKPFNDFGAQ